MKNYMLILILAFSYNITQAQYHADEFTSPSATVHTYKKYDPTIKGTPFINGNYALIKILKFKDATLSAKYNAYDDYMEVLKDGKKVYFEPSKEYPYEVQFLASKKTYKAFQYEKNNKNIYGFFKIVAKSPKGYLLTKETVGLIDAIKPETSYTKYQPAKFVRKKDSYYFKFSNKTIAVKIPKRKRDFYKLFDANATKIKKYVKKERLNIKKERDLMRLLSYYNQL